MFDRYLAQLSGYGLQVSSSDRERPWGGFLVIEEAQAAEFIRIYFPDLESSALAGAVRLSPKLLLVQPGRRLSWQYHFRRAEIWRCLEGPVQVITSEDDTERISRTLQPGDSIRLAQGERHRLIGMDRWAVVAEIWQHTLADHPSDEEDIVRLQDDYGR